MPPLPEWTQWPAVITTRLEAVLIADAEHHEPLSYPPMNSLPFVIEKLVTAAAARPSRAGFAAASVPAAGRAGGVSEATVYRRLREPDFRAAVEAARAEIVSRAVAKLSAASTEAAEALRRLLYVDTPFARLAAARAILELGARLREQEALAERVRVLEERLAGTEATANVREVRATWAG